MAMRRQKILAEARKMIAEDGFDALNLRDLADRAGITVPTIYNLIGNKAELVQCLFEASIAPFEPQRYVPDKQDPVAAPEVFFANVFEYLSVDENDHRAEFLARWHIEQAGDPGAHKVLERVIGGAINAIKESQKAGLLRGLITPTGLRSISTTRSPGLTRGRTCHAATRNHIGSNWEPAWRQCPTCQ